MTSDRAIQDAGEALPGQPRAWRLRAADRLLERLWARGLAPLPSLDPQVLNATAGARSLPDRSGWRRRLEVLCGELEGSARLTPLGRTLAHGQLAAALRDRARLEALWTRHLEIAEQPLAPPIVIVGQMRSGTTRLQRLLACDPRLASTSFAESWNPVPSIGGAPLDDRVWRARVGVALSRVLNPDFAIIHPTAAAAPDEQIGWHAISIFGSVYDTQWRVPAHTAQVETDDAVPAYREFRRILQTVLWLRREDGRRPVVLKIPQFSQDLDALLTVFPGLRLLRLDRDPVAVVASSASLVRNQMEVQSDNVSPGWIGRETLRKVALRHRRTEAALRTGPAAHLPIDYDAMSADWEGEMARVYGFLDLPFTPDVRAGMARLLRGAKRHRLDRHRYALADYGLTAEDVRAAIADPSPIALAAE